MINSDSFSNVEEYIDSCPEKHQNLLRELRKLIINVAPKETEELISYKMPTYRYNGNLIHFALFKNHLGIYPGPDAIENFKENLVNFKTTKGAIQIPLDQKIPRKIITDIIRFNISWLKDKKGSNWTQYRPLWIEAYEVMEQIIVKTELIKEHKWGTDIYTFNGKNVVGWAGFKDFFSLWFYNGVFLEDKEKHLVSASEGKTKSLRQWRFTSVKDMDEKQILNYILESVQTIRDGKEIKPEKSMLKVPEGLLKSFLAEDSAFGSAFNNLTPGKQREYIEYIEEAKQEKTKITRIEKIIPLVLAGKGLNDKYKR